MNLQLEQEYCYVTFRSSIIAVLPGLYAWVFSLVILPTVGIKATTYLRKEKEDIDEGEMEVYETEQEKLDSGIDPNSRARQYRANF